MKTAKLITTGCLLALALFWLEASGYAQTLDGADHSVQSDELSFRRSLAGAWNAGPGPSSPSDSDERGVRASDIIRGNGTRAGYVLSHGGVIPNSESIRVDGSLRFRNRDYYLDTAGGMLVFAAPVRRIEVIQVDYRYVAEKDGERSLVGAPTLALNFAPGQSVGITYAYKAAAEGEAFDLLTYGLNLATNLGAQSNMANMMYVSSPRESGRVSLNLEQGSQPKSSAKPKTGRLFLHNSDLQSGRLSVKLNYQDVGEDFAGFAALKQQKAAPSALLAQLEKERGLRRFGLLADYDLGEDTSAGVGWSRIGDGAGDIVSQSLSISSSSMKLSADFRQIDEGFTKLGVLTPAERQSFGKETGMRRMNITGDFKLNSDLQVGTSVARVTTKDAGLVKYGLSLKGSKFNASARYQDIAPEFGRIADLADPDKEKMAAERGMKRYDLTAHIEPSKSVRIDSFFYNAKHSRDDLFKRQLTNNIVINPARGPKLSIFRDEVISGESGGASKCLREKFTLNQKMGILSVVAIQDTVTEQSAAGEEQTVETRKVHFTTDPKARTSLIGDWKRSEQDDGEFENVETLRLSSKLSRNLSFVGMRSASKMNEAEGISQEYLLKLTAPKDYGMFKGVSWSVRYVEALGYGGIESRTKAAKVASQVMNHQVAVEYLGAVKKDGQDSVVRSFSVASGRDPKKRLHYGLAYKVRDPGAASSFLIRCYDADWQVSASTKLTYNYSSYNEKPGGELEPTGIERLKVTTPLTKKLGFIGQWENVENYEAATMKDTLSLGLSGNVSSHGKLEASYGFDRVVTSGGETSARTYKLEYDYQASSDHFFALSGKYTDWSGPRPCNADPDDLLLQLDFKTLFG